jgi:DNA gyrase inhibitor GyrI
MISKSVIFVVLVLTLCLTFRNVFASINGVEMLTYSVISKDKDFEKRHYDSFNLAKTIESGDRQNSIGKAFKRLFAYISGKNKTQKKISMTSPVLQQAEGSSWHIAFIMPKAYILSELPKPLDNGIQLQHIKASDYYCLRFSGRLSDKNLQEHLNAFQVYLKEKHYQIDGSPIFAFYDPPWTLPFFRRNELWGKVLKSDRVVENQRREFGEDKDHHKTHH